MGEDNVMNIEFATGLAKSFNEKFGYLFPPPGPMTGEIHRQCYFKVVKRDSTAQKATIHQVITMLATSKNVLFPGHNHLLTTGADDPTL